MTADQMDRTTSAEIFELLDKVEEALGIVRLYVADSLLHPEGTDGGARK